MWAFPELLDLTEAGDGAVVLGSRAVGVLGTGVTLAIFHACGTRWLRRQALRRTETGSASS